MDAPGQPQLVVLNGGSSAGKSEISRCLQMLLGHPWLRLSVDDLVDRLPPASHQSSGGIDFGQSGEVTVGAEFRTLEAAWLSAIAAMAARGANVIYEDVFLEGADSQERTRQHMVGLQVLWVGVRCEAATAAARERARADRPTGMAALQADAVHVGVAYDLEVETTSTDASDCAREVADRVRRYRR